MPETTSTSHDTPADREVRVVFGAWVLEARMRLGYSQAGFGAFVGLHQSTISRLERGRLRYLHFHTAVRLLLVVLDALAVPHPRGVPPVPRVRRVW